MSQIGGTEIANLMVGLEGIHELRVELTIGTGLPGVIGSLAITASAWADVVGTTGVEQVCLVPGTWPEREGRDLMSYAFSLLYDLDRLIGEHYRQKPLVK
jgi:hypothetical protein